MHQEAPAAPSRHRGLRIADLPKPVLCIPLVAQWLWLALRHRSLTLPSALNPQIETGGLAGETKSSCLAQIGPGFADWIAPWRRVGPGEDAAAIVRAAGIDYPLVAKPDIGWCGFGVRRIGGAADLAAYVAAFPREAAFLLQRFVPGGEAGLFYLRVPGSAAGQVVGITLRHPPVVYGDGVRSVAALRADGRAPGVSAGLSAEMLARVAAPGEAVPLGTVASLRVGGRYEDATPRLTTALQERVDAIARSMPDFHAGRFDVRFATLPDLLAGRFRIIEVNGAGSEAIHLWDERLPILTAFAGVFAKQATLFRLGAMMRARGHRPVGVLALAHAWLRQQRLIARYPPSN